MTARIVNSQFRMVTARRLSMALIVSAIGFVYFGTSHAYTNAANWLIKQEIANGCGSAGGAFTSGVIEQDLTGDGKKDLIIDHSGLECKDSGLGPRSGNCGIRACSVLIYVRQGKLLKLNQEVLSIGVEVGNGKRPNIKLMSHNFEESAWRWDGKKFK